jgi:hypothetical protein
MSLRLAQLERTLRRINSMPINLKPIDPADRFTPNSSVLFVVCHVCPRMCLAAEKKEPYFSITQVFKKADYFEEFISGIRDTLKKENIRSTVFKAPFFSSMMCLWSEELRDRLREQLSGFDAVAVIGCSSAVATVESALNLSGAKIVQLMEERGIANFKSKLRFPLSMEMTG